MLTAAFGIALNPIKRTRPTTKRVPHTKIRALRPDGEATRARILEAAGQLFADQGYVDTSNKDIAARAGTDLALINYYFGSRGGLYYAVLAEAQRHFFSNLSDLADSHLPARAKLEKLIENWVAHTITNSGWHGVVLGREMLSPSSHLEALFAQQAQPQISAIVEVIEEITGIPRDDPTLVSCLLTVTAPCVLFMILGHGLPGPLQEVFRMPPQFLVKFLHKFALAGLKEIRRDYQSSSATK